MQKRDFIGYGEHPPNPKWPNGAKLALNLVVNFEEGSERSPLYGESFSEATLTDAGATNMGVKGRDLAAESMFEYGTRVGFWRILKELKDRNLTATYHCAAISLEQHPPAATALAESDHEICAHGWRWINQFELEEEEEREHIRKCIESIQKTTGKRPLGWYCRYGPSMNTRRLLVEEGGFLYDSNSYADDLPYWVVESKRPSLVIPHTFANNDNKFARGWWAHGEDFFIWLRDAFDVLYHEGNQQPKLMSISLHQRITGHPARFAGFRRFLDYIQQKQDVWICRRVDIARHWHRNFPFND